MDKTTSIQEYYVLYDSIYKCSMRFNIIIMEFSIQYKYNFISDLFIFSFIHMQVNAEME